MFLEGFAAPPNTDLQGFHAYIDEVLPPESPYLYGLHPNAEMGFLTTTSENLFRTVFEMQPRDAGSSGGQTVTREDKVLKRGHFFLSSFYIHFEQFVKGETSTGRDTGKAAGGIQHGGDNGQSGGAHAVRDRRIPGMRAHELPHGRDQTIASRIGSRSERRADHHVGHGRPRNGTLPRSSATNVDAEGVSLAARIDRLVRRPAAQDTRAGNLVY